MYEKFEREIEVKRTVKIGLSLWLFVVSITLGFALFDNFAYENFATILIGLTAFHPDPMVAEESNKLFFFSWAAGFALLLGILVFFAWKRKSIKLARIFVITTIVSFIVGFVRFFSNLHIA